MPQSPASSSSLHTSPSTATSTMSLAILPSAPMAYNQPPVLVAPSPSKRPKLSLNTSTLPAAFGKKATSLRLETLSATSPTIRNTFSNAHEEDQNLKTPCGRPQRPALSSLSISTLAQSVDQEPTPTPSEPSSSAASATSTSTVDSLPAEVPYKLNYNTTSILSNGPIPRTRSVRRGLAQSKPMFPSAKKVAFKAPLEEEIKTEKYTWRHSDIESSASTISTLELSPPEANESEQKTDDSTKVKPTEQLSTSSPQTGEKRESSDEEDSDTCPATPVAGRRKRHRQWVWTLGPVQSSEPSTDSQRPGEAGVGQEKTGGT